jgi:acetyl-CoA carboxylase biotin carboxyl carrier protein
MPDVKITSDLNGSVWKIEVAVGARVVEGDTLILIESMKMEIPVSAPRAGTVKAIFVKEEQQVAEGETLAILTD